LSELALEGAVELVTGAAALGAAVELEAAALAAAEVEGPAAAEVLVVPRVRMPSRQRERGPFGHLSPAEP